jgi:hypothetical protein
MESFKLTFDEFMIALDEQPLMLENFNAFLQEESKPADKKKVKKV